MSKTKIENIFGQRERTQIPHLASQGEEEGWPADRRSFPASSLANPVTCSFVIEAILHNFTFLFFLLSSSFKSCFIPGNPTLPSRTQYTASKFSGGYLPRGYPESSGFLVSG